MMRKIECPNCGGYAAEKAISILVAITLVAPLIVISLFWSLESDSRRISIAATLVCLIADVVIWTVVYILFRLGRLKTYLCFICGYEWNPTDVSAADKKITGKGGFLLAQDSRIRRNKD